MYLSVRQVAVVPDCR